LTAAQQQSRSCDFALARFHCVKPVLAWWSTTIVPRGYHPASP
jgi:hypothetical protein